MSDEHGRQLPGGEFLPEEKENKIRPGSLNADGASHTREDFIAGGQDTPTGEQASLAGWPVDDFAEAAEEEQLGNKEARKDRQTEGQAGVLQKPDEIKGESPPGKLQSIPPEASIVETTDAPRRQEATNYEQGEPVQEEPHAANPAGRETQTVDFKKQDLHPAVENKAGATVENTAEQAVENPSPPPAQVPGSMPAPPPYSQPGESRYMAGQMPSFGGNPENQPLNSTGYQHSQQSFPQHNPQAFPPPQQPYTPLPYSNGYPPPQGRPPVYPQQPGYPAPPPYQPMYVAPQPPPAYQWPEHHAGTAPGAVPPKKKMNKSTRIFLWIACSLAACFVLGFGVYGAYIASVGPRFPANPGSSESRPDWNTPPQRPGSGSQRPLVPGGSGENDPTWGGAQLQDQPEGDDPLDGSAVYEKAKQSVVGIRIYEPDADLNDSYVGEGSGVIMTQDGYIITNSHVLGDSSGYGVQVVLYTGEEHIAKVVGIDKRTDLAVIKIDVTGLTAAELGDSDDLRVGNRVYALGNPGGLNYFNSLTGGWVSALDRAVDSTAQTAMRYIQTDAAINPGNSGGALLNRFGQVVGINTAKIQGYEGMGFSIPMSTAKEVIDDLMRYGYVAGRVRLGITGQQLSSFVAQKNGVPQGVLIKSISNDSPLRAQGVKEEDIITHINAVEITAFEVLTDELANFKPGDTVKLTVYREGHTFEAEIVLLEDKGETQQAAE